MSIPVIIEYYCFMMKQNFFSSRNTRNCATYKTLVKSQNFWNCHIMVIFGRHNVGFVEANKKEFIFFVGFVKLQGHYVINVPYHR